MPNFGLRAPEDGLRAVAGDADGHAVRDDGEVDGLEIMDGIIFNPVFLASTIFIDDGEGFLQVSLGGYAVDIGFRIDIPN